MSLINEALKKAQKQRTGEAPPLASLPAIGGESARHIARRGKPASFNSLLIRLGLGAAGLVIVLVVGVLLLRRSPADTTEGKPIAAAPVTAPATPLPGVTATVPAQIPAKPAENVFVLPIAAPPVTAQPAPPKPEPKSEAPKPAPAPVIPPETPKAEPARATSPGRLEPRAITYIDNIRVAGIRASATDSKVLMNDRVYRVGDIVEHELGLTLVGITSSSLTFEDQAGGRYTRNF